MDKTGLQPRQMLRIDVGGGVAFPPTHQRARKISNAGADFENSIADVRTDGVGHPAIETRCRGKGMERARAGVLI